MKYNTIQLEDYALKNRYDYKGNGFNTVYYEIRNYNQFRTLTIETNKGKTIGIAYTTSSPTEYLKLRNNIAATGFVFLKQLSESRPVYLYVNTEKTLLISVFKDFDTIKNEASYVFHVYTP